MWKNTCNWYIKLAVYRNVLIACWDSRGSFYLHALTLIPAGINNQMSYKKGDEITCLFPKFNGCSVAIWESMSNFILPFAIDVIIYQCWDQS